MSAWRISNNVSSADFGVWTADSADAALAQMAAEAGAELDNAGDWSVEQCAMSADGQPIEAGDWIESTSTNPDDFDDGRVREVLDDATVLVAWRSGVVTPCPSSKVVHGA
jgi:hypothetical protein